MLLARGCDVPLPCNRSEWIEQRVTNDFCSPKRMREIVEKFSKEDEGKVKARKERKAYAATRAALVETGVSAMMINFGRGTWRRALGRHVEF